MILYLIIPFIAILLYGKIMEKLGYAKNRYDYIGIVKYYNYYKSKRMPHIINIIKWALLYGIFEEVIFRFIPIYFLGNIINYNYIILVVSMLFALLHFLNIKVFGNEVIAIYGKNIKEEEKPILFFGLFLLSNYLFHFYLYNEIWQALLYSCLTHITIIIAVGINQMTYIDDDDINFIWWSNGHKVIKSPILWLVMIIPNYAVYLIFSNTIALILNILLILFSTLIIYIISLYKYSTDINVLDGFNTDKEKLLLKAFFTYPLWALIQQIIVIIVFLILSKYINPVFSILITSILFGMVHIRNKPLAISCFILEILLLTLYYFHKNIYILAITHGWIASCGLYMLPNSLHNGYNI
jgi:membrane protease YdiL (CAAX protease family)